MTLEQMREHMGPALAALVEDAEAAFWRVVAERFPRATTGDLDPATANELTRVMTLAIAEWIVNNVR